MHVCMYNLAIMVKRKEHKEDYLCDYQSLTDFQAYTSYTAKQSSIPSPTVCWKQHSNCSSSPPQIEKITTTRELKKRDTCSGLLTWGLSSLIVDGPGKVPKNALGSLDGLAYRSGWLWTSPWDIKFLSKSMWWGASASSSTITKLPSGNPPPSISKQHKQTN